MLKCWAESKVESEPRLPPTVCVLVGVAVPRSKCIQLEIFAAHLLLCKWLCHSHVCVSNWVCVCLYVCVRFSLKCGMWKFNRHLFHLLKCFCSRSGAQTANCNFNCNNREIIHTHTRTHTNLHWLTCVCNWIAISVCWVWTRVGCKNCLIDW